MAKNRKKAVTFVTGVAKDAKGHQVTTMADALAEEAKCGCGIDCCKGVITLWDQDNPNDFYEITIKSGEIVLTKK